jgi:uncharacterized protein (DUF1697 family)
MQTYIAILRGINVTGHKSIKMEALRAMCEEMKFKNTQTYIQSGNIIFQFKEIPAADLEKKIAKKIKEKTGFDVPVIVKNVPELKVVLKNNPFIKRKEDVTKLHVTFLNAEPDKALHAKIKDLKYDDDEFMLDGAAIYLFCPKTYGNTKLNNNFFENKLKLTATTRNWRTVNELLRIAEEVSRIK